MIFQGKDDTVCCLKSVLWCFYVRKSVYVWFIYLKTKLSLRPNPEINAFDL